jgi:hypothetical protein
MTAINRKEWLGLALVLGATGFVVMTSIAGASHPYPQNATRCVRHSCRRTTSALRPTAPTGRHSRSPSCNPPTQSSSSVTVGTPDANGAPANSIGSFTIRVSLTSSENLILSASISDVRCKPGTTACGNANAADGPDYVGELEANTTVRVTDHFNAAGPGGGTDPATVVDIPNPVRMFCTSTADTSKGGVCNVITGPCPPGGCSTIRNGDRTVIGIDQIRVFDGGADGQVGTGANALFAVQGIFIP